MPLSVIKELLKTKGPKIMYNDKKYFCLNEKCHTKF